MFYLRPVILENNHAGLWIHPLQDQGLPVSASIGNHEGHRSEWVVRKLVCHEVQGEEVSERLVGATSATGWGVTMTEGLRKNRKAHINTRGAGKI